MYFYRKITYTIFNIQRREDLWGKDALVFDPDRWLDARHSRYMSNPFIWTRKPQTPRLNTSLLIPTDILPPSSKLSRLGLVFALARTSLSTRPPSLSSGFSSATTRSASHTMCSRKSLSSTRMSYCSRRRLLCSSRVGSGFVWALRKARGRKGRMKLEFVV